ncbi:zinc finger protein [Macleaya cordata]|uniref:RING-type E3 ubiquitin transferase n=1 Tax=Macleaya cordata TaxID=56857 RepID=A0A200QIV0_MACCD|nr:zinc finger protein [Macleaya cordata]
MSFAGQQGGAAGGAADHQLYFCYQCNRTVSITPSPSSDLVCPSCNGGFLEEYEEPNPNPNLNPNPFFAFSDNPHGIPSLSSGLAGIPLLFSSSSMDLHNPIDISRILDPDIQSQNRPFPTAFHDPDVFNPFMFLQNYIHNLRAGGANIQFVIENNPSDGESGNFRLPANLGDYFIGPGLEQLIQQLAENDPNRYGTPPASKSAVEALPDVNISDEMLSSDSSQCAVCKDMFELGTTAKQMPCKHIYHPDCILPWLELHNSCPVCRYELPTDDPDYERRSRETPENPTRVATASGSVGSGEGTQENAQTPRTAERRFRISFPWPFRPFASPAETSGSGFGTNNNNDGDSNSGNRGNRDFGSETRQEDLD